MIVERYSGEGRTDRYESLVREVVSTSPDLIFPTGTALALNFKKATSTIPIAAAGGVMDGALPCSHFQRQANWNLNQVLRWGLELAGRMTGDRDVYRRVRKLGEMFDEVDAKAKMQAFDLDEVERGLTRLTASAASALTLIRLLFEMQGASLETTASSYRTPAFLFDMNFFFQNLLSRFLRENLEGYLIKDEHPVKGMFSYPQGIRNAGLCRSLDQILHCSRRRI